MGLSPIIHYVVLYTNFWVFTSFYNQGKYSKNDVKTWKPKTHSKKHVVRNGPRLQILEMLYIGSHHNFRIRM